MKKSELKNKIASSYEDATPEILDNIKSACEGVNQVDDEYCLERNKKRSYGFIPQICMAVACMLVLFVSGMLVGKNMMPANVVTPEQNVPAVAESAKVEVVDNMASEAIVQEVARIYLDVNPSIELKVDNDLKVLDCVAINADAQVVIKDMELKGVKVDVAMKAIVGSMYMNGYLQGNTDAILVSVDSKVDGVFETVTEDIDIIFKDKSLDCKIITQVVSNDENIKKLAKDNGISEGKMTYIDKIIKDSVDYTEKDIKDLSGLTIKALNDIFDAIGMIVPEETKTSEENKGQNNATGQNANPPQSSDDQNGNVVSDTLDTTEKVVDDTLNTTEKIVDESLKTTEKIVDSALDTTEKIVDKSLDTTEKIVDGVTDTVGDVIKDTTKETKNILKNIFKTP